MYVTQNIAMQTSSMLAIGLYNNTLGCNLLSVSHAAKIHLSHNYL